MDKDAPVTDRAAAIIEERIRRYFDSIDECKRRIAIDEEFLRTTEAKIAALREALHEIVGIRMPREHNGSADVPSVPGSPALGAGLWASDSQSTTGSVLRLLQRNPEGMPASEIVKKLSRHIQTKSSAPGASDSQYAFELTETTPH